MTWHAGPLALFDLETTGTDPHRDRIVTAAIVEVVKQMGSVWAKEHGLRGKADALDELPEGLRVREFPGGAS